MDNKLNDYALVLMLALLKKCTPLFVSNLAVCFFQLFMQLLVLVPRCGFQALCAKVLVSVSRPMSHSWSRVFLKRT